MIKTPKQTIYRNIRLFVESWKPESLPMRMNRVIADFYRVNGVVYVDPDELFRALRDNGYVVDSERGVITSRQTQ